MFDCGYTAADASMVMMLLRCSCVYCIANSNRVDRSQMEPNVSWYEPQDVVFCSACEASNLGRANLSQPAAPQNLSAMPPVGFFSVTPPRPPRKRSQTTKDQPDDRPPIGLFTRPQPRAPLRDLGSDHQSSQDQSRVKRSREV